MIYKLTEKKPKTNLIAIEWEGVIKTLPIIEKILNKHKWSITNRFIYRWWKLDNEEISKLYKEHGDVAVFETFKNIKDLCEKDEKDALIIIETKNGSLYLGNQENAKHKAEDCFVIDLKQQQTYFDMKKDLKKDYNFEECNDKRISN